MDSSDPWKDIQALKSRQSSFREKLLKRKKEREEIVYGQFVVGGEVHCECGRRACVLDQLNGCHSFTGISCNDKGSATGRDGKRLLSSPRDDSDDSADYTVPS